MEHKMMVSGETSPLEYVKFAAVLATIFLVAWLLHATYGTSDKLDYLRWFMGVFFIVFGSFTFRYRNVRKIG